VVITQTQNVAVISGIPATALIHWEYCNGEVATRYFAADSSNPELSNWWGLLTISMQTWVALGRIRKRAANEAKDREACSNITLEPNPFLGGSVSGLSTALHWN